MNVIEVGDGRVAYERTGDGPPLVLLHGYVGDGPTTWQWQLEQLADEFTVVAWDAPGAGRSSDPPETIGMAGYADTLAAFISQLGLERPYVAGLSFGGALAIEFARRHPGVARTLILVSAYAGWAGSLPADVAEQRLEQALMLAELLPQRFVDALLPTMFSRGTPPTSTTTTPPRNRHQPDRSTASMNSAPASAGGSSTKTETTTQTTTATRPTATMPSTTRTQTMRQVLPPRPDDGAPTREG